MKVYIVSSFFEKEIICIIGKNKHYYRKNNIPIEEYFVQFFSMALIYIFWCRFFVSIFTIVLHIFLLF